jgi:hypothetical protein
MERRVRILDTEHIHASQHGWFGVGILKSGAMKGGRRARDVSDGDEQKDATYGVFVPRVLRNMTNLGGTSAKPGLAD